MRKIFKILFVVAFTSLFLASCAKNEPVVKNNDPLKNTYWKLTKVREHKTITYEKQTEAHIILKNENKIVGSDGCNRIFGSYNIDKNKIEFSHLASTRMACMKGMTQAHEFSTAFAYVKTYKIQKNKLFFYDENKNVILEFISVYLN